MVNKENFEEELKKKIFDAIYEIQDKNQQTIMKVLAIAKYAGLDIKQPANIARTSTNKLILDIVPQFKRAGLKFYSDSVVSQAIYTQIIKYISDGNMLLTKFCESLTPKESKPKPINIIAQPKNELTLSNKAARFWARIRTLFVKTKSPKMVISDEDKEAAQNYMREYEEKEQQLWNYNIRDNIISALTQVICPKDNFIYLATSVPTLVDQDITPVLQQLGLGDLVPKLEEALIVEYTKAEEDRLEYCFSQNDIDLYVPNFKKYREKKKTTNKLQEETIKRADEISEIGTISEGIEPGED